MTLLMQHQSTETHNGSLSARSRKTTVASLNARTHKLTPRILVVDDDDLARRQLERQYRFSEYDVVGVDSAEAALTRLEKDDDIDLVVTDLRLPGLSGIDLTERIAKRSPDIPIIARTGYADVETAVQVLKLGATDYIVKPVTPDAIQESTRAVLEKVWPFIEIRHLRRTLKDRYDFGGMLSKTPEMHRVFEIIHMVSTTDVTVLVEGETGTGKELVATAIHHHSTRQKGPFITINCAGVPESLLESELFGYERGAFTGAEQSRPGKIELAHGGTLFLDEIESMSLAMQAKLLLVLQDRKVQRLGNGQRKPIDMRVIAASNVPLEDLVAQGQMRSDFYYRIKVVPIRLLPLRQRRDDVPLLVQDFLRHHPVARQKRINKVAPRAMHQLFHYAWPGNVRELQNVLERALVLTNGNMIEEVDLPQMEIATAASIPATPIALPLREWLNEQEKYYLTRQLELCKGRISRTAAQCGVDTKTLYRKMRSYGLDKRTFHDNGGEVETAEEHES
ncbi:MAG: sigma-54-dependent Fis family transcriptional regulator [Deltaproteobacteria bacterium]|nr:sigma-54-dependent Fis family transcriptional regulator [Deltaproteobacteria bacterium]